MANKEKEIIKLYESGLSSVQIGKKLNKSNSGIRLILRRNNIKIRSQSKANLICKDVRRGLKHSNWKGGKTFHKGQVYIRIHNKRVKESHYNWCITNSMLSVPKNMIIHHIDCNPHNNDSKNLILLDQSTHVKVHNMIGEQKFERYLKKCEI